MSFRRTVAATLVAAGCLCVAACGGDPPTRTAARRSSSTSETTSSSTKVVPTGEGTLLTDDDAVVVPPSGGQRVTVDPADPCAQLEQGGRCEVVDSLAWVTPAPGTKDRSPVTVYVIEGGTATPAAVVAPEARSEYGSAHVLTADLDGRAGHELVVGLRNAGTGGLLQLDIVGQEGTVLAHLTLDRGRAALEGAVLRTWAARYLPDDPNCCPSRYEQAMVTVDAGRWRLVTEGQQPAEDVPEGDFP